MSCCKVPTRQKAIISGCYRKTEPFNQQVDMVVISTN